MVFPPPSFHHTPNVTMTPPKSHIMRPMAPAHAFSAEHSQDFRLERLDHDTTDVEAVREERDTALAQRLRFDNSDDSDSSYTLLSDILDGLPTAVVKSLGPLRTIRRSASIRGWVSYFYEISTSSMGAHVSHEAHVEEHHHHHHQTLVSTSTTTAEVEMQQQHLQQHQPMNSKRRRASNAMRTTTMGQASSSTELVEYVEPERRGIDRFCGMQGEILFFDLSLPPPPPPSASRLLGSPGDFILTPPPTQQVSFW